MFTRLCPARIKAAGPDDGLQEGQFDAIVSVFENVDSYGDVVMRGAFTDDLARWAASGDPLPVIWSHDWRDPFSHLGRVLKAEEREKGLWIRGQIDDLDSNAKAAQVYRLMKGRRVTQHSFAYDIEDAGWGERGDQEVFELRKLKLHEVGPCLLGVNQETELLAIKARDLAARAKAGTVIDLAKVRSAYEALGGLLESAPKSSEPDGSDAPAAGGGTAKQDAGQPGPGSANEEHAASGASSAEQTRGARSAQAAARLHLADITGKDLP